MAASRLLSVTGLYAPTVLYGSGTWRPGHGETVVAQHLPAYALLAVEEGAHRVRLGADEQRLCAGECCLLLPDRPYHHLLAPQARLLYVVFSVTFERLVVKGGNNTLKLRPGAAPQPPPVAIWGVDLPFLIPTGLQDQARQSLRAICELWWRDDRSRFRANHHLITVLHLLVTSTWNQAAHAGTAGDDPVARALACFAGRPPPASVETLAVAAGLHRNQFTRRFRAVHGIPPAEYLRRWRLQRAEELLAGDEHTIQGVAREAGYRNVAALDHAFTAAHGCPPSRWRRRQRE